MSDTKQLTELQKQALNHIVEFALFHDIKVSEIKDAVEERKYQEAKIKHQATAEQDRIEQQALAELERRKFSEEEKLRQEAIQTELTRAATPTFPSNTDPVVGAIRTKDDEIEELKRVDAEGKQIDPQIKARIELEEKEADEKAKKEQKEEKAKKHNK